MSAGELHISVDGQALPLDALHEATRRRIRDSVETAVLEREVRERYQELLNDGEGWESALDKCAEEYPVSRRTARRMAQGH